MPPKRDVFKDDADDDFEKATKDRTADLKSKIAEAQAAAPGEDKEVEVDLDEAEETLGATEQTTEQRESRNERRRNRYRDAQESRRQAEEQQQAAERRAEAAERRAAETHQLLMQLQARQQAPATPQVDPLDAELEGHFREQNLLYADYRARAGSLTQAEADEFDRKNRELQRKIVVTGSRIGMKQEGLTRDQIPSEERVRQAMFRQQLEQKHGDVVTNEQYRSYADGQWKMLVALGKPDDWNTLDEAMEMTRKAFGLRTKNAPAPTASYKSKLAGNARGAGPSSEDKSSVTMSKEMQRMADEMYRHVPDRAKRMQLWANGAGRKLMQQKH